MTARVVRLVNGQPEKRRRRYGRRAGDHPLDVAHLGAVASVSFLAGLLVAGEFHALGALLGALL
jgi:hypothetical protein